MNTKNVVLIMLFFLVMFSIVPLSGQDAEKSDCAVLVEEALATVSDACSGLGRNKVCYGHNMVAVTNFSNETPENFAAAGDTIDVTHLSTLTTAPLAIDEGVWGIALLSLQANLSDTLPGQNVTFVVFGDTELVNEIPLEQQAPPSPILTAQSTGNINTRSGPDTGYDIVGTLAAGDEITLTGRNETGDWGQFSSGEITAWVYIPLLTITEDVTALQVVDPNAPTITAYTTPIQAFRLTAGIGRPLCEEAPRDGLLVQAPTGITVYFRINSVDVTVGSTALLLSGEAGQISINTFDGQVSVTSAGETQIATPGERVDVVSGQPPAESVPYSMEDVLNTPVELLPEEVFIPPPGPHISIPRCSASGGIVVSAGKPLVFRSGWIATARVSDEFRQYVTQTFTYDGQVIDMFGEFGPVAHPTSDFPDMELYRTEWYWVVPNPTPGQHQTVLSYQFERTIIDDFNDVGEVVPTELNSHDPFSCTVTVQ